MFQDAAVALQNHLKGAVEAVGERLDEALEGVARKVEVQMSVLWECASESEENVRARMSALATLREHKTRVEHWIRARKERNSDSG
ncbi:hypothetical protein DICSQDRAFT_179661 [Dichomitus squalens LYAD-421 SS1]|uniref:uncharacterized protein n=1 Tax=Dichomitus squalens (strain LYAD-421) TaxID=732165 RepID=UPI0004413448|nr:uncharacterized protein DICSQDRAFT_179661 [Dichomitus squalens LYAD-421 SS1]EJF62987.1 hypothetical protein DICSQDRAFT_179661 [Dichomitus squalens LYAD-421 SS1]